MPHHTRPEMMGNHQYENTPFTAILAVVMVVLVLMYK